MGNNISKVEEIYDPRYKDGKIYTITCEDGAVYVGSTIQTLKERFRIHKKKTETCHMNYYIRDNYDGDWSKCKIELYENYPCNSEKELERREGEIIRLLGTINKQIVGRTYKEWYDKNREKIREYDITRGKTEKRKEQKRIWDLNNREYKNEKIKCECGCWVSRKGIAKHRRTKKHQDLMKSK